MGRVIFASVLVTGLVVVAIGLAYASGRRVGAQERGLASREGVTLLDEAAKIMSRLGITTDIDDPEIIRTSTSTAVGAWLVRYHRVRDL